MSMLQKGFSRGLVYDQSRIEPNSPRRSRFVKNSTHKTTLDSSVLVPIFWKMAFPGDHFRISVGASLTMPSPFVRTLMDDMQVELFGFKVPCRILWEHFPNMMGEQANPGDSIDFDVPQTIAPSVTGFVAGNLMSYFGMPQGVPGIEVSDLLRRGYFMIWDDWFRDQNQQNCYFTSAIFESDADTTEDPPCLPVNRRHDYFSSCLPWPQKGNAVSFPLGTSAPVYGNGTSIAFTDGSNDAGVYLNSVPPSAFLTDRGLDGQPVGTIAAGSGLATGISLGLVRSGESGLYADLANAVAGTINDLRYAVRIQQFLELDARSGTRYNEYIKQHWGVVPSDGRMQRSEFCGSTRINVFQQNVPQTAISGATPQGYRTSIADAQGTFDFDATFDEHGILMIVCCVRGNSQYQYGIPRQASYKERFDFPDPIFAHLGEMAVLNKEIYAKGTTDTHDNDPFGYQEQYAELRYDQNFITGKLNSRATGTLHHFHLAEQSSDYQELNGVWLYDQTFDALEGRVLAVPSEPHFIADFAFRNDYVTAFPVYGTPSGLLNM